MYRSATATYRITREHRYGLIRNHYAMWVEYSQSDDFGRGFTSHDDPDHCKHKILKDKDKGKSYGKSVGTHDAWSKASLRLWLGQVVINSVYRNVRLTSDFTFEIILL